MTDKQKFENFLFEKWLTFSQTIRPDGDAIIHKEFSVKEQEFSMIARFSNSGGYCNVFLITGKGETVVNGKGFSVEEFIEFIRIAMKG